MLHPTWYVRDGTDHRPAAPPARGVESVWWTPWGVAWWTGTAVWIPVGDRLASLPCPWEPFLLHDGHRLVASLGGDVVVVHRSALEVRPRARARLHGADITAVRAGLRWSIHGLRLPEGARRTPRLRPFPLGVGAVWASDGWLYRLAGGRGVDVLGLVAADERFYVGPHGAVLVGHPDDEGEVVWTRGAAPGRPLRPLPLPLPDVEVRWSPTGGAIAALAADTDGVEGVVRVELASGAMIESPPGLLPADDVRRYDPVRGVVWRGDVLEAEGLPGAVYHS